MAGLWVSLRFRDGEVMEGIIPNNLLQLEHRGFTVIPPDPFGNQQRVCVPRRPWSRSRCWEWWAVRCRSGRPSRAAKEQIGLFDE